MEVMVVGFGVRGKGLCFKEPSGDLRCRASAIFSMAHIAFDIDINPGMKKEGEAGCISCISLRLAFITSSHIPLANHKSQSNFKKGWRFWSNHFPQLLLLGPSLRCRVSQNSETRCFFSVLCPFTPKEILPILDTSILIPASGFPSTWIVLSLFVLLAQMVFLFLKLSLSIHWHLLSSFSRVAIKLKSDDCIYSRLLDIVILFTSFLFLSMKVLGGQGKQVMYFKSPA